MEVAQSRAPAPETSESYRASSSSNGAASSVGLGNRAAHGQVGKVYVKEWQGVAVLVIL